MCIGRISVLICLQLLISAEPLDRPLFEEDEGASARADLSSEAAPSAVNLVVVLPNIVEAVVVRLAVNIGDAGWSLSLIFHFCGRPARPVALAFVAVFVLDCSCKT